MSHAASEPVELPDDQRVARLQGPQRSFQAGRVPRLFAFFILENQLTICTHERIALQIRVLVIC